MTRTAESFFDEEADRYDAAHDREEDELNPLWIRMAAVLRLLGPRPGSVVDCGMGPGRLLAELDERGWIVAGVDASEEMVDRARARVPGAADRLHHSGVESLPFAPESFDAAVATGVFEYVADLPAALGEVARVLRPGGLFCVSMPNTRAPGTFWRHRIVYTAVRAGKGLLPGSRRVPLQRPGLVPVGRLEELLRRSGLRLEHVEYLVVAPAPLRTLSRPLARRVAERLRRARPLYRSLLSAQYVATARKD